GSAMVPWISVMAAGEDHGYSRDILRELGLGEAGCKDDRGGDERQVFVHGLGVGLEWAAMRAGCSGTSRIAVACQDRSGRGRDLWRLHRRAGASPRRYRLPPLARFLIYFAGSAFQTLMSSK